ncbi:MAG: hypothetical protein ACO3K7_00605 [Candidatus Marinamargulisbacteria bacterium]
MTHDLSRIGGADTYAANEAMDDSKAALRKKHQQLLQKIKSKDGDENGMHTNPDKVSRPETMAHAQSASIRQFYKPIFQWEKSNDNQSFHIVPNESSVVHTSSPIPQKTTGHMLALLGYKIDVSQQVDSFKQKLQKFFIESKSHNPLVGKFSELKFGMVSSLLSLLGIAPSDIEDLKKEALQRAIQDNINNFTQNEYNTELMTIFKKDQKDAGRMKILDKLRDQLIQQMALYGQPDYYTNQQITTIKKNQITKIRDDLLEEQQNLKYIRNFQ